MWWRSKFFFRRQSDSSLIVGRIIDPRPGLRALSMDDLLRDAIANLQTTFSGSENTQELLLRVKTIYHPNWRESVEVLQNIPVHLISYHVARPLFYWIRI